MNTGPVDDLQVEHEKLMHVIGVREDLGAFIHIHPQRAAPGLWDIIHIFTNVGRYQIWSDIKHRGAVYSVAHPRYTVAGEARATPRGPIPQLQDHKSGYDISLRSVEPALLVLHQGHEPWTARLDQELDCLTYALPERGKELGLTLP